MVSEEKSDLIFYLCSSIGKVFSPLWFLSIFFFIFDFLILNMICPGVAFFFFFAFILLGALWDSWICALVSVITLGKSSVFIASNITSVPFFHFFLVFPLHTYYIFCSCPTVLGYSVLFLFFFSLFFFLCFYFGSFYWHISSSKILFSAMSSLIMSSSKASSFLSQCFWSVAFLFYSFLEFPSLFTLPISSCMLSTVSILIIIVLNFLYDNSQHLCHI